MTTAFDDLTDDLLSDTDFLETVVYTPQGGAAQTITSAIWSELAPEMVEQDRGGEHVVRIRVSVLESDLASPMVPATITRSATGEVARIEDVRPRRGGRWNLMGRRVRSASRMATRTTR